MHSDAGQFNRLYIHVPFCQNKCDYCAFYSETGIDEKKVDRYLKRLSGEFKEKSDQCSTLKSIYIGGGTPTYLSAAQLERLFSEISSSFEIHSGAEISIEANPDTLDDTVLRTLSAFCTRISVGVQTLDKSLRSAIGRKSREYNIGAVIEKIKKSSIQNISCDLIYGIPGQTCEMLSKDLNTIIQAGVTHISAYSLTYEENTILGDKKENEEEIYSELEAEMWDLIEKQLYQHSIYRYEISNYSKEGYECRHNLEIWYGDTYLGCGPAAASFDGRTRTTNPPDLRQWLDRKQPEADLISQKYRAKEILMMGLRTVDGWKEEIFHSRTGFSFSDLSETVDRVEKAGLIRYDKEAGTIKCTSKGLACWNDTALIIIQN
jgi:oxygen-independent coproporphyrinogen-3 oxidase